MVKRKKWSCGRITTERSGLSGMQAGFMSVFSYWNQGNSLKITSFQKLDCWLFFCFLLTPSVSTTSTFPFASSSICLWILRMASKLRLAFSSLQSSWSMRQKSGRKTESCGDDVKSQLWKSEWLNYKSQPLHRVICNHFYQLYFRKVTTSCPVSQEITHSLQHSTYVRSFTWCGDLRHEILYTD